MLSDDVPCVPPYCDIAQGIRKEYIRIPGGKLYYEVQGEGVPLVLIAGGPGNTHHIFHPYLTGAAEFSQVIYYDQRGTGLSCPDSCDGYSVRQAIEDLEHLRRELKLDHWIVLGHSYGGLLAQCYALEHPESLLGMVLVAADPACPKIWFGSRRQHDLLSEAEKTKIAAILEDGSLSTEQMQLNIALSGGWKGSFRSEPSIEQLVRWIRYAYKPAPGFHESIESETAIIDLQGQFEACEVPTLLIEGKHDPKFGVHKPKLFLENHPGANLIILDSFHIPFADQTSRFIKVLKQFTADVGQNGKKTVRKPGNRMVWPPKLAYEVASMPLTGAGDRALELYAACKEQEISVIATWARLGLALYDDQHYRQAMDAFKQLESAANGEPSRTLEALAWQGLIFDILDRRPEAIECYRRALDIRNIDETWQYGQYDLTINRQWVMERMKIPFYQEADEH